MMNAEYVYSVDGEGYIYHELGDVITIIENNLDDGEVIIGQTYYRGIAKKPLAGHFCPSADWIFDQMRESAGDTHGEYAEDFTNHVSKEKENELEQIIEKWCNENIEVDFWGVTDIQELVITEDDI